MFKNGTTRLRTSGAIECTAQFDVLSSTYRRSQVCNVCGKSCSTSQIGSFNMAIINEMRCNSDLEVKSVSLVISVEVPSVTLPHAERRVWVVQSLRLWKLLWRWSLLVQCLGVHTSPQSRGCIATFSG